MSLCCITSFHLLSIPNISQNIPHWVFLHEAFSPPSPESPSTRHRLLDRTRVGKNEEGEGRGRKGGRYGLPSLSARESNGGRTDGLNLHGRLSAFPISRMHTFSSPGNSLGSRRREGRRGEVTDNKRRRSRHKSRPRIPARIFASERKKKGRGDRREDGGRMERARGVGPSTTAKLIRQA